MNGEFSTPVKTKALVVGGLWAWALVFGFSNLLLIAAIFSSEEQVIPQLLFMGQIFFYTAFIGIPISLAICQIFGHPTWFIANKLGQSSYITAAISGALAGLLLAFIVTDFAGYGYGQLDLIGFFETGLYCALFSSLIGVITFHHAVKLTKIKKEQK